MEQKTPLYDCHLAAKGKMVSFAGYQMPVQYSSGLIQEHLAVRQQAGLFDVSHMGEVMITGPDALKNLNHLFTNDFTSMTDGRVRYSLMCQEGGGVLDDLIVYRYDANRYLVVVNASNREKDVNWMKTHLLGDVLLEDISNQTALIALQGPNAKIILTKLCAEEELPEKYYTFRENCTVAEKQCMISQTGYTGEFGYELYCTPQDAAFLWESLLDAGKENGLIPCGLGARDTLRLEAGMPLYGHEMDETISPLETGLSFAVKMKKNAFIGKDGIASRGEPTRQRVGLQVTGRGIIREDNAVFADGMQVGITTSGTHCPYLKGAYAMALLDFPHTTVGTELEVDVRGRRISAQVVALPFYHKNASY